MSIFKRGKGMKEKKRIRNQSKSKMIVMAVVIAVAIGLLVGIGIACYMKNRPTVLEEVTLEVGQEADIELFLEKGADPSKASFEDGDEAIDTSKVGVDLVTVIYRNKSYIVCVEIKDTVAPQGTAVAVTATPEAMPAASDCVKDIVDLTAVEATFKEEIDMSQAGETTAIVVLTDEGGNTTEITVPVTVILDSEPPVIEGAKDIVVYVGDTVSYRSGVTVTDNKDENPTLEIDNSAVDLEKVGEYPVTYTATDEAGNTSSVSITVTVAKKQQSSGGSSSGESSSGGTQVDSGDMNALAQKVYDQIITDDMTQMQKAFAIYRWVKTNIGYTGSSDKSSWEAGAYQAFKNRSGDCFNYYAAGKALLNIAGIQNVDIVKSDTSHSRHYWSLINVGSGWYHFDCTPRKGGGNFFMLTDAELAAYSESHNNSHIFDSSLYPERATESVQEMVNYSKGTVSQ